MRQVLAIFSVVALGVITGAAAGGARDDTYLPSDAERARWTMSDMRTLAIALAAYHIDRKAYPGGASLADAIAAVEPIYVRKAPTRDAWGTPFRYLPAADGSGYMIVSAGADRVFEESPWDRPGESDDFADDVVLRDDRLIRTWQYR